MADQHHQRQHPTDPTWCIHCGKFDPSEADPCPVAEPGAFDDTTQQGKLNITRAILGRPWGAGGMSMGRRTEESGALAERERIASRVRLMEARETEMSKGERDGTRAARADVLRSLLAWLEEGR